LNNFQPYALRFLSGLDYCLVVDGLWRGNSTIDQAGMWLALLPAALMECDIRWISLAFGGRLALT
jgi:hypothetical protein